MKEISVGMVTVFIVLCSIQLAAAVPVINNGDFETGDFSNWNVGSTQFSPYQDSFPSTRSLATATNDAGNSTAWWIKNVSTTYQNWASASPIDGASAFHGFDGSPGTFYLTQDFTISDSVISAILNFDWAYNVSMRHCALDRKFNVLLRHSSQETSVFSWSMNGIDTNWSQTNTSIDLTAYFNSFGEGDFTLAYEWYVPQCFTGPAQFAIDNINLDVTSAEPVPEPTTMLLFTTGIAGLAGSRLRRKKK